MHRVETLTAAFNVQIGTWRRHGTISFKPLRVIDLLTT
jgi:hypothetical protein